jgi:ADP-ribose pyrophosphatase YjhB (NUDIX family)
MAISEHYAQIRRKLGASLILVPGVAAIIRDETGRVLFQKKHDGTWSLPAGAIESGENPAQAVVREVREETGLKVKPERIVGVFGGEGFRHRYPNGHHVEYARGLV